jgi:hypothetical protein
MIRDVQRGLHPRQNAAPNDGDPPWHNAALLALTTAAERAPAPIVISRDSRVESRRARVVRRLSRAAGKPISADGARAIATALVAKYQHDGYAQPLVQLDDTLLAAGVLRIDVSEPRISEVRISGDPGPHLERLEEIGAGLRRAASRASRPSVRRSTDARAAGPDAVREHRARRPGRISTGSISTHSSSASARC